MEPTRAAPASFDPELASRMAFLALVAMCEDDDELQRWAKENGYSKAHRFKAEHNRAVILRKDSALYILFGGTNLTNWEQWSVYNFRPHSAPSAFHEGHADWLKNERPYDGYGSRTPEQFFKNLFTGYRNNVVHAGFLSALHSKNSGEEKNLWEQMLDCVGEIKARERIDTTFVSGHSLGGAMAVLALADIAAREKNHEACPLAPANITHAYVLGTPRTGDVEFTDKVNAVYGDRLTNGVFRNDPIPRLPLGGHITMPGQAVIGMRWAGVPYWISEHGQISWNYVPHAEAPGQIQDHLPGQYERALQAAAGIAVREEFQPPSIYVPDWVTSAVRKWQRWSEIMGNRVESRRANSGTIPNR